MSDPPGPEDQRDAETGPPYSYAAMAPEVSRRVSAILDAVEREAARLRAEAEDEAGRYLDDARRQADALVEERRRRIAELSDELMRKSEAVVARLDDAAPVRRGFENLVRSLGEAAERLAREGERHSDHFQPPPYYDSAAPAPRPPEPSGPGPAAPIGGWSTPASGSDSPLPPPAVPRPVEARDPEVGPVPSPPVEPALRDPLAEARSAANELAAAGLNRGQVREHLLTAMGIADSGLLLDDVFGQGSREDARAPWVGGGH